MFTGLIEQVGRIVHVEERVSARVFQVHVPEWSDQLELGESIAVDGICLTVATLAGDGFVAQAMAPTLERTTAGRWQVGRAVNLERALRAGSRLGGHILQGHVDCTGQVVRVQELDDHIQVDIRMPEVVGEVTVLHGSLGVDGVSLTVSALPSADVARVALIPHTVAHTNLSRLAPSCPVNLEGDLIGRFIVAYLKRRDLPVPG
jgi:riboflavin synthase